MLTAPFLGTQPDYVLSKQDVALYSQTPLKFSVARPPERVGAISADEPGSHCFFLKKPCSFIVPQGALLLQAYLEKKL